jgi:uncharacterized protein
MSVETELDVLEILIIGSPETGKSRFVETICERATRDGKGWHFGHLNVDGDLHIQFIEPPSSAYFDFMWMRELIDRSDVPGFIVVCDSTQPERFGEAVGLLQTVQACHPYSQCVLVANKQDLPQAWNAEDIRIGLNIPENILVVPCVAHDVEAVKEAVLQLLYQIFAVP